MFNLFLILKILKISSSEKYKISLDDLKVSQQNENIPQHLEIKCSKNL